MIKKTLASCVLLMLFSLHAASAFAQYEEKNDQLTFSLGSTNGWVKDELFSPLNYKSNGGTIGINYLRRLRNTDLFIVDLDLKTLEIESEVSSFFFAEQVQLNMEMAYLRRMRAKSSQYSSLYLGFDIHSNGNLMVFEDEITLSNSGTYVSHRGLGIQILNQSRYRNNFIRIHAKLPVLGWVYRSPYNLFSKDINDDQLFAFIYTNRSFGTLHNYLNPSISFSLSRSFLSWFKCSIGYELDYLKSSVQKPITDIQGRLLLSTTFQF